VTRTGRFIMLLSILSISTSFKPKLSKHVSLSTCDSVLRSLECKHWLYASTFPILQVTSSPTVSQACHTPAFKLTNGPSRPLSISNPWLCCNPLRTGSVLRGRAILVHIFCADPLFCVKHREPRVYDGVQMGKGSTVRIYREPRNIRESACLSERTCPDGQENGH